MNTDQYHYTVEKLTTDLKTLCTNRGDVRTRLRVAYRAFHTLTANDFPPECQDKWNYVMKEMKKFGPKIDHNGKVLMNDVDHTLDRRNNVTGERIAKVIYELYWEVSKNTRYQ